MAITITQQPYTHTPVGQKLIISATSTNISETGFLYKAVVSGDGGVLYTGYIKPNPLGALVFDLYPIIKLVNAIQIDGVPIHSIIDVVTEPPTFGVDNIAAELYEAWIVDGVLEDNPDELDAVIASPSLWNATFQPSDGYRPDPATRYALTSTTKNWLTDRIWNTHINANVPVTSSTGRVFIPVRETDYGVLSIKRGVTGSQETKVVVTIFDSGGAPHSFEIELGGGTPVIHLPVYPANLNASAFDEMPSMYANWRYITVIARDASDVQKSVAYYLYNVAVYGEQDCIHDVVRIGWKNYAGGWDYFNFIKRNEQRIQIDKKRFQKVLGNYADVDGSTDFNFTKQDSGLMELKPLVNKYLDVHSDWISEQEFVFLESLFVSQQVHWIHDDGTFTPVLVEQDDYLMARERNGRLKNIQTKFRLANPVWV